MKDPRGLPCIPLSWHSLRASKLDPKSLLLRRFSLKLYCRKQSNLKSKASWKVQDTKCKDLLTLSLYRKQLKKLGGQSHRIVKLKFRIPEWFLLEQQ